MSLGSSLQFKMVSMCWEKPILLRAPPRLSEVCPTLPLKGFQCSSDWRWTMAPAGQCWLTATPLGLSLGCVTMHWHQREHQGCIKMSLCSSVQFSLLQFRMVFMRSEKSICSPPLQGRSSSACSWHASQAIGAVALCPQVVSQAPQHFKSSEKQATCGGCFACQCICRYALHIDMWGLSSAGIIKAPCSAPHALQKRW